jgi:hypothetical protein
MISIRESKALDPGGRSSGPAENAANRAAAGLAGLTLFRPYDLERPYPGTATAAPAAGSLSCPG